MLTFETQLKKLKYLVLKEVATLAKENELNKEEIEKVPFKIIKGDKPQYRSCINKERESILEATKLAAGYIPDDVVSGELVKIDDDKHIIYVLPAACDKCSIYKYTVTDACRGCIQHKCMEVCPVKAISRVQGRAYINHEICRECGLCKKACPYNAIAEVLRPCKASCPTGALEVDNDSKISKINKENCINCGACMASCPFGAISDKSYIVPVTKALVSGKRVHAVVAPAIAGQFGNKVTVGMIKDAFNKMGFKSMVEAACGADAVTIHETLEFSSRMEKGDKYMTNSCCPGFVGYIEKKFPSELSKISTTVSPMVATGRKIKKEDKDSIVVFIGPCTAKKVEATKENLKDSVDFVLTFEELTALIGAFNIDITTCNDLEINDASSCGRGFGQSGGVSSSIQRYIKDSNINVDFRPIKVSGKDEIKKTMTMAKVGKLSENFIEGMMCEGGCVGGAGAMASMLKSKGQLIKFSKSASAQKIQDNENMKEFKDINMEV